MDCEVSVELGAEDPVLDMPWQTPDERLRYFDLKRRPELLLNVTETWGNRELAELLASLNAATSPFETAKCDWWSNGEITPEEEVFGESWKFGCYVDLIFAEEKKRFSFAAHEQLAHRVTSLVKRAPEMPAAAEFLVRRCFYSGTFAPAGADTEAATGFYITLYVHGYGADEESSRKHWVIALRLIQNAMLQISSTRQ